MADEQQFIEDGLQRSQIDEFFADELARAGYGGMDIAKTPMGTQIVLLAEKPGMVIGKGGKNIRKVTTELEERFELEDPQIDVQEVDEPDLNARIVADRLANALERGWYFRKAGHTTIDRIMEAGALGAEIVLSGKVTGARSRVEKFNRGYIKHNGEPASEIVDEGQGVAVMKLGTIGVTVKIIPPEAELPDDFAIHEGIDVEAVEQADEEGLGDLLDDEDIEPAEPDESVEPPTETPEEALDEEVVEEVVEEVGEAPAGTEPAVDVEPDEAVVPDAVDEEAAGDETDGGEADADGDADDAADADDANGDADDADGADIDDDVEAEAAEVVAEMEGSGADSETDTDDEEDES